MAVDAGRALINDAEHILVFAGAGLSTESGIPDFRGPDGLWKKVDPADFSIDRYVTSPEVRERGWAMHARGELWGARADNRPNRGHLAITDLWSQNRLVGCITQNVDGLQQVAGLPDPFVAEVHGNVRKVRCLSCLAAQSVEDVLIRVDQGQRDPKCIDCGGILKTSTVLFGEFLPTGEVDKAIRFSEACDAVVAVGTSLSVYPAADFAFAPARRGVPLIIVNQGPTDGDELAMVRIDGPAGDVLPELFVRTA